MPVKPLMPLRGVTAWQLEPLHARARRGARRGAGAAMDGLAGAGLRAGAVDVAAAPQAHRDAAVAGAALPRLVRVVVSGWSDACPAFAAAASRARATALPIVHRG